VKTQQLITNALHRSKLDLHVSFCEFIYIYQVHQMRIYEKLIKYLLNTKIVSKFF